MTNDLVSGPVGGTELPKPSYIKPQRKPEIYTKEVMSNNEGKIPREFVIQEKCGIEDMDQKTKKKFRCEWSLHVVRIKNTVFVKDEAGYGGQLMYDENDVRMYKVCPDHGGLPKDYDHWEPTPKSRFF